MPPSRSHPDYKRLCRLLVQVREEAGLTQTALAARLRRPQSFVSKVESGERRLDVIEFLALAKALEIDPARLLRRLRGE